MTELAYGPLTGRIARLAFDKGFGFATVDGIDYFFHHTSVEGAEFNELCPGARVEIIPEASERGPRAGRVRLIEA